MKVKVKRIKSFLLFKMAQEYKSIYMLIYPFLKAIGTLLSILQDYFHLTKS